MSVGSNRTNSILNYLKAKSSCIEHTWNEDFTKATYNYYSNHVKVFWDSILEKLQTEYGYTRREAITYIAESSDFTVSKVKRFFSGKNYIPIFMHFEFLEKAGFDAFGNLKRKCYSAFVEKDRLIIERKIAPKFSINLKIGDWYDLQFIIPKTTAKQMNKVKLLRLTLNMTKFYFNGNTGDVRTDRRNPYQQPKLKNYIQKLYVNNELKIGRKENEYVFETQKDKEN